MQMNSDSRKDNYHLCNQMFYYKEKGKKLENQLDFFIFLIGIECFQYLEAICFNLNKKQCEEDYIALIYKLQCQSKFICKFTSCLHRINTVYKSNIENLQMFQVILILRNE
jgi:hypothetical protein